MKRFIEATAAFFSFFLSLNSFAIPKVPVRSTASTDSSLSALDACAKEHWEGWCSLDATTVDADPAPESARSFKCLNTSLSVFREAFEGRKSGVENYPVAATTPITEETVAKPAARNLNAQLAANSYARCALNSQKLIQYFTSYATNRESARNFCMENQAADNSKTAKRKLKNFENAVRFHYKAYTTNIPLYAKASGLTARESTRFRIHRLATAGINNFEDYLNGILTNLGKDCERGRGAAGEHLKVARRPTSARPTRVVPPRDRPILIAQNTTTSRASTGTPTYRMFGTGKSAATPSRNNTGNSARTATGTTMPNSGTTTYGTDTRSGGTTPGTGASTGPGATGSAGTDMDNRSNTYRNDQKLNNQGEPTTRPSAPPVGSPTTNTVDTTLENQCAGLPTRGSLTAAQNDLKAKCLSAGLKIGPNY